jgi:hypothetical protein
MPVTPQAVTGTWVYRNAERRASSVKRNGRMRSKLLAMQNLVGPLGFEPRTNGL